MEEREVKFIRTLHNQLIIGSVIEKEDTIIILQPYNVIPGVEGMQISQMDLEIVGEEIKEITLYKTSLIYFTKPGKELRASYLEATTGISVSKPDIII